MLTAEWNLDRAIYIREQEAREEGIEKGRAEERDEIAKKLLQGGISPDIISKSTGLSLDRVRELSK